MKSYEDADDNLNKTISYNDGITKTKTVKGLYVKNHYLKMCVLTFLSVF